MKLAHEPSANSFGKNIAHPGQALETSASRAYTLRIRINRASARSSSPRLCLSVRRSDETIIIEQSDKVAGSPSLLARVRCRDDFGNFLSTPGATPPTN